MKKYKIEIVDMRDYSIVYKHSTNNFEQLTKWYVKYKNECKEYLYYRNETTCELYENNEQDNFLEYKIREYLFKKEEQEDLKKMNKFYK